MIWIILCYLCLTLKKWLPLLIHKRKIDKAHSSNPVRMLWLLIAELLFCWLYHFLHSLMIAWNYLALNVISNWGEKIWKDNVTQWFNNNCHVLIFLFAHHLSFFFHSRRKIQSGNKDHCCWLYTGWYLW